MRRVSIVWLILALLSMSAFAQTKSAAPAKKPATAAQPAPAAKKPAAPAVNPVAVFDTTAGKLTCTLFPDKAPLTVANFIGLAEGTKDWTNPFTRAKKHGVPLYSGTIFHRVIPGFMIQGGDPKGTGEGDPGYSFKDEFSDLKFDVPGRLAMANSGPNTNGSQFFITDVPTPHLNGKHTIFGQCDAASLAVVKKIEAMPRDARDKPFTNVKINKITIERGDAAKAPATEPAPPRKPAK